MRIAIIALATLLILFPNISEARHYYIKPDSTGDAINIQAGIDSCSHGDTVLVAPGIFRGDGNRDIDFKGKQILVIAEKWHDPAVTDSTIIDCEGSYPEYHRGFYFHSGEDCSSILKGFIIENGANWSSLGGGGIACDSSSSPTILNNTMRYCKALRGSAIACANASPEIINNIIYRNGDRTAYAAAIDFDSSSALLQRNEIVGNITAAGSGGIICYSCSLLTIDNNNICSNIFGAITIIDSDAIVKNNIIGNNSGADDRGFGGIGCIRSRVVITGNDIYGNDSWWASAILSNYSTITVDNNNIYDNLGGHSGGYGVIYLESDSASVISNNILRNNRRSRVIGCSNSDSLKIINNEISYNGIEYANCHAAITCRSSSVLIKQNIIISNYLSELCFGVIKCYLSSSLIIQNTIADNILRMGAGICITGNSSSTIRNNIICNNTTIDVSHDYKGGIYAEDSTINITCNDVYNNTGGNYVGISDQTGINGNISLDPIFCDPSSDDYTLASNSPCLPGNHPHGQDCGLIGALGQGCEGLEISLDIKPGSCPNPLNPKSKGKLPVAILGTDEFDVTDIDPSTILLEGVSPIRWNIEDVAAPVSSNDECACTEAGPDGIDDLTLKFSTQDIAAAIHDPAGGYKTALTISGGFYDGTQFEASDCIIIVGKEPEPSMDTGSTEVTLGPVSPNPFNPWTMIGYYLPFDCSVTIEIYDVTGRRIASLLDREQQSKGAHSIEWGGIDDNGRPVASGIYFCRLIVGRKMISQKIVLLR